MLLLLVFICFLAVYLLLGCRSFFSSSIIFCLMVLSVLIGLFKQLFSLVFFQSAISDDYFLFDELSFWLVLICGVIVYFSFGICWIDINSGESFSVVSSFVLLFVVSSLVFSVSNFFVLYLCYELSLLPILFIILKLGVYPDRFIASIMILLYTTLVSFPLIVLVLYFTSINSMILVDGVGISLPILYSLIVLVSFAVNLPVYGIHYWLPMAHVEAPTSGSMILAGVLLKLGGASLLRFSSVASFCFLDCYLLSYLIFSIVLSSVITSMQVDFNRLVAYSSVVHISMLVLLFISQTLFSYNAFLLVMVLHGFVSPIMFMIVGVVYKFFSTRLFPLLHGILMVSYGVAFLLVIIFLLNVPTPPFSSFVAEVVVFLSLVNYSIFAYLMVGLYVFFSLVFNIVWLASSVFGNSSLVSGSYLLSFYEMILALYFTVFMLVSVVFINLF